MQCLVGPSSTSRAILTTTATACMVLPLLVLGIKFGKSKLVTSLGVITHFCLGDDFHISFLNMSYLTDQAKVMASKVFL